MWLDRYMMMPLYNGKRSRYSQQLALYENQRQFQEIFIHLSNLWLNMFEWKNMPEGTVPRALERTLFFHGKALFFDDPNMGLMHTPVNLAQGMNVYYQHTNYRAYSFNYNAQYNIKNSVLIKNNEHMWPTCETVEIYTNKILDAARTIDVVAASLKRPTMAVTSDDTKLTCSIVHDDITNNEHIVYVDKNQLADLTKVTPLPHNGDLLADLWRHKNNILSELYTKMGINNANTDKRERLITAEADANNQIMQLDVDLMLDLRQEAAEQINAMFGTNISVAMRHDYIVEEVDNEAENNEPERDNGFRS